MPKFLLIVHARGTLYAFNRIGWKYFLVFICISPFLIALFFYFAEETKGKTLEEIGGLFGDVLAVESLDVMGEKMEQQSYQVEDEEIAEIVDRHAGKH